MCQSPIALPGVQEQCVRKPWSPPHRRAIRVVPCCSQRLLPACTRKGSTGEYSPLHHPAPQTTRILIPDSIYPCTKDCHAGIMIKACCCRCSDSCKPASIFGFISIRDARALTGRRDVQVGGKVKRKTTKKKVEKLPGEQEF